MSYRIALASGKKGTPRELVGEVLGVIGGGFLFRQGARQLVGLIPVAGIAPKVAVVSDVNEFGVQDKSVSFLYQSACKHSLYLKFPTHSLRVNLPALVVKHRTP